MSYCLKSLGILFWYLFYFLKFLFSPGSFLFMCLFGVASNPQWILHLLLIVGYPFIWVVNHGLGWFIQQVAMGFHFSCIVLLPQHNFPWVVWQGDMTLGKWDGRLGGADWLPGCPLPHVERGTNSHIRSPKPDLGCKPSFTQYEKNKEREKGPRKNFKSSPWFPPLCCISALPIHRHIMDGVSGDLRRGMPSIFADAFHGCSGLPLLLPRFMLRIPFTFHIPETAQILCSPDWFPSVLSTLWVY